MSRSEMRSLKWDELDVLLVSGDAYVDHPSFGVALLGRWLVSCGYRVGIVAQPRWDSTDDLQVMGAPRLFTGVTAGALDSMLAHYTAFRKKRHDDAYTPGGKSGARPNRACLVYTGLVRQAFPGGTVVLGGIEASLRRTSHYDFWGNKLRRSILLDSKADALCYGMAEKTLAAVARQLDRDPSGGWKEATAAATGGLAFAGKPEEQAVDRWIDLPSHEAARDDPKQLVQASLLLERQVHRGGWAQQRSGNQQVLFSPPASPLATDELDALYRLPFSRRPHPSYTDPIPAVEMIRWSVTAHRGCGGGCSFCSLALHQGRRIRSRSQDSIQREVKALTKQRDWRGSLSDVGGPSANMWGAVCRQKRCKRDSCLVPGICPHLHVDQQAQIQLLDTLQAMAGVKHVRVASGVRFDLALQDRAYVEDLVQRYIGGQLKLAPEHCVSAVLKLMRKPDFALFEQFLDTFAEESKAAGKRQYVIPYLMSAFPGTTESDMQALADWLRRRGWKPEQVQCFIPLPGTVAGAMYYAGCDTAGNPIHVARSDAERLRQHHALLGNETAPRKRDRPPKGKRRRKRQR